MASKGWPKPQTLSPSVYVTVPTAPAVMSPLASPTAIEAPGTSCWGGNEVVTGAKGAVVRRRCARAEALRKARATGSERPPTAMGAASGFLWRAALEFFLVPLGGSTGRPRTDSIGVASATWPP